MVPVTFRRSVLEGHPEVKLMTYLTPEFDALMDGINLVAPPFVLDGNEIGNVSDLENALAVPG